MTITLVSVLLICLSYGEFSKAVESHDDVVECVFAINVNSTLQVSQQNSKQMLQNIGKVNVRANSNMQIVEPGEKRRLYPITIYLNNISNKDRAIVYVSNCDKNDAQYIKNPDRGYDRINILKKAFALGVKDIPNHRNMEGLISAFSLDRKDVWTQIHEEVKDLLDGDTQQIISTILNNDIPIIKHDVIELDKLNKNRSRFDEKYNEIIEKLGYTENRFILKDKKIFNLYLIPLYSNIVTLKLYFYNIGLDFYERSSTMSSKICEHVYKQLDFSFNIAGSIKENALDEIYNTAYAGALYNVMMKARSHFAWHILEMIPKWNAVLSKCGDDFKTRNDLYALHPISYSDLYGRGTPDLLQQALNVEYSPLVAEDKKTCGNNLMHLLLIGVGIKKSENLETVCGLTLHFECRANDKWYKSPCFGTCTYGNNIELIILDLTMVRIITLKVYKTKYIRCLKFSFSNNITTTFGNHCEDNSTNVEFQLQGHYIHSLYLANDYPETNNYFDNVAVSFLPNEFQYT